MLKSTLFFSLLACCALSHASDQSAIFPPGVTCTGDVPRVAEGEYYLHQNQTYELKVTTKVNLDLTLFHRSCFEVVIDSNDTNQVSSIFYVVEYQDYIEDYPIHNSYRFGIPEMRSYCKCDCPKADSFCTHRYDSKFCSKGEVCVQKFHSFAQSYGCQEEGSAKMCCDISIRPYQDRRFRAILFGVPMPDVKLKIDIHVLHKNRWSLFRSYSRSIYPTGGNKLKLNGFANLADLDIRAEANDPRFRLSHDQRTFYYFEENRDFDLLSSPIRTQRRGHFNYDFLIFEHGRWNVKNPRVRIPDMHVPIVSNCQAQKYTDQYKEVVPGIVVRNSTGSINFQPEKGPSVIELNKLYVNFVELLSPTPRDGGNVLLHHNPKSAPVLHLTINLHQRLSIVAHLHLSHLSGIEAKISLDKHRNRYLNITLINAYGSFRVQIYKGPGQSNLDLTVPVSTKLPLSSNYSEILPLPGHVNAERYVCVHPERSSKRKHCEHSSYQEQPVEWYTLPNVFIETKGNCPGCNEVTEKSFFAYLNPRTWFNGIGTISEGLAVALEIGFYVIIALILIALFRRVIWPIIRWALCPAGGQPRYTMAKEEVSV